MTKRSKYGVKIDEMGRQERTRDGIVFSSKREMQRYAELKLLQKAGEIRELELQPEFPLHVQPADMPSFPVRSEPP